jgi:NDP-4-keto-2,6-dideoxyhexose 3-C-methyltransferase
VSEEKSRAMKPDAYLVLPWHFREEFIERERQFLLDGGTLIFPLPTVQLVTKDDLK